MAKDDKTYKYTKFNGKKWCLEYDSKYFMLVVNKDLFTNGCKKVFKYV